MNANDVLNLASGADYMNQHDMLELAAWMETNQYERKFVGPFNDPFKDQMVRINEQGRKVTIRKGTRIYGVFTDCQRLSQQMYKDEFGREYFLAGRTYKVTVHSAGQGSYWIDRSRDNHVNLHNPQVTWPGPGGYWRHVDINEIPEYIET